MRLERPAEVVHAAITASGLERSDQSDRDVVLRLVRSEEGAGDGFERRRIAGPLERQRRRARELGRLGRPA